MSYSKYEIKRVAKKIAKETASEVVDQKFRNRDLLNAIFGTDISHEIKKQVKSNGEKNITRITDKLLNLVSSEIDKQLPGKISNSPQLNTIINNNLQRMESIYKNNEQQLVNNLSVKSTEIIEDIVSDDKYTQIIDPHITAINNKGNDAINNIDNKAAKRLNMLESQLNSKINEYDRKIRSIERKNDLILQDIKNNNISWLTVIAVTTASSALTYYILRRSRL